MFTEKSVLKALQYGNPLTCQTRLVFSSNSIHHLCVMPSLLQEIDEEEEIGEKRKKAYNQ